MTKQITKKDVLTTGGIAYFVKRKTLYRMYRIVAGPPGIEPRTPGFLRFSLKARCSILAELRAPMLPFAPRKLVMVLFSISVSGLAFFFGGGNDYTFKRLVIKSPGWFAPNVVSIKSFRAVDVADAFLCQRNISMFNAIKHLRNASILKHDSSLKG
jgi:hypothetical protein